MRWRAAITVLAGLGLVSSGGCLKDRCKTPSPNLELEVTYSGFDPSDARYLEFETRIQGTSKARELFERQGLVRLDWSHGSGMTRTYLFNLGAYANHPEPDSELAQLRPLEEFRVRIRVYGRKAGVENALLAEGLYTVNHPDRNGCYIQRTVRVTTKGFCDGKVIGDPCVGPDGAAFGVCRRNHETGWVECRASECGDGYTDRRSGELCDLPDASVCGQSCLPRPVVADVTRPSEVRENGLVPDTGAAGKDPGELSITGFWSLAEDATSLGYAGSLFVDDVDDDGLEELLVGVPGHSRQCSGGSCRAGAVYLIEKFYGSKSLGEDMPIAIGPTADLSASRESWFGVSVASGDFNQDGERDLVVGAPRAAAGAGRIFVFSGARDGLLSNVAGEQSVMQDSSLLVRALRGEQGDMLGYQITAADLDGDGAPELLVSAPALLIGSDPGIGGVYVLSGSQVLTADPGEGSIQDSILFRVTPQPGQGEHLGPFAYAHFGISMAVGDLNADGLPDVVVGSTPRPLGAGGPGEYAGGITVLFGDTQFFERVQAARDAHRWGSDVRVNQPEVLGGALPVVSLVPDPGAVVAGIGPQVQVVDVNGDGYGDVVSGLSRPGFGPDEGKVFIVDGRYFAALRESSDPAFAQDVPPQYVSLVQGPANASFGLSLGAVDVNADRRLDLLIGAPTEEIAGLPNAGSVYALLATPRAEWFGEAGQQIDVTALRDATDMDPVPNVPLIWLRGTEADGYLGLAFAGSATLSDSKAGTDRLNPATYVLGRDANDTSRVWKLNLYRLLPCSEYLPCPRNILDWGPCEDICHPYREENCGGLGETEVEQCKQRCVDWARTFQVRFRAEAGNCMQATACEDLPAPQPRITDLGTCTDAAVEVCLPDGVEPMLQAACRAELACAGNPQPSGQEIAQCRDNLLGAVPLLKCLADGFAEILERCVQDNAQACPSPLATCADQMLPYPLTIP